MNKNVIMISGKQGSGKTTTAIGIVNELNNRGVKTTNLTFASILYEMHDAVRNIGDRYGIPRVEPKDGKLLQLLGTEWGRAMDVDIWTTALRNSIERDLDYDVFVISDLRFRNEFDAFPESLRVRLECGDGVRKGRCSQWRTNAAHQSEVDLDSYVENGFFDMILDTSILSPEAVVDKILDRYFATV